MNKPPRHTGSFARCEDGTLYKIYSDGSLRREPRKIKGKAAVKAAKRARHK